VVVQVVQHVGEYIDKPFWGISTEHTWHWMEPLAFRQTAIDSQAPHHFENPLLHSLMEIKYATLDLLHEILMSKLDLGNQEPVA